MYLAERPLARLFRSWTGLALMCAVQHIGRAVLKCYSCSDVQKKHFRIYRRVQFSTSMRTIQSALVRNACVFGIFVTDRVWFGKRFFRALFVTRMLDVTVIAFLQNQPLSRMHKFNNENRIGRCLSVIQSPPPQKLRDNRENRWAFETAYLAPEIPFVLLCQSYTIYTSVGYLCSSIIFLVQALIVNVAMRRRHGRFLF